MLQLRLEEQLFLRLLDRESLKVCSFEGVVQRQNVEVQVIGNAVGAHRVVAESQLFVSSHFED